MNTNRKAFSPVLASIILIAVTVAVSIAVAAWMGALSNSYSSPYVSFEYQIPKKYNATIVSFNAEGKGSLFSASATLVNLPHVVKGTVLNNTRVQISVTYYQVLEQQSNIFEYKKVGDHTFELLVRDITGGD